ncbi:hypothetical protein HHL16_06380 [Pseudoflavitalea sp. G-6-1-2]|uniref:hypothetical protein n=1 Tax=Pseudoflavitalea sp. G-6-1-2 TaxID=2728841 RepID=UPI00146D982B|nr:hypothetical protein [Pseudoflavitalea sp. G-6-1-2]NML20491.1 hypothetical protein [Pseudoflavitalea sp. G-6-1-2]
MKEQISDDKSEALDSAVRQVFLEDWEEVRLRRNMNLSDMEKLRQFTRMLRRSKMFASAKITHHPNLPDRGI